MAEKVHPNVLVVSDESRTTRVVLEVLAAKGIRGTVVPDVSAAMKATDSHKWDVVIAGQDRGNGEDCELLRKVKTDFPELPVIRIGRPGDVEDAVRAVRAGYDDFLVKPVSRDRLDDLFATLLPSQDVPLAASAQQGTSCIYQIAGASAALESVVRMARKVAPTSVPVLLQGESGTGKELVAYLIHHESNRLRGPYIRVNCASLSESLLESELFGHERGAFTGAHARREGRFERAHGGTLLLDEIAETSLRLQAELLRVLETQDFERVGGSERIRVNVRVIATTNRDLYDEVQQGRFRADLYYRINGVRLTLPALRERVEDIPVLVWHFVNQYAREVRRHITDLDAKMLDVFGQYHWPGNIRQLRNVVRALLVLGAGSTLSLVGPRRFWEHELLPSHRAESPGLRLQDLERHAVLEALRRTNSHYTKAAGLLGITDRTLREKVRRYRRDGHLDSVEEGTWATGRA